MTTDLAHKDASEHSHPLFNRLFRGSQDAIVVTDLGDRISVANPAVEQLFGYSER